MNFCILSAEYSVLNLVFPTHGWDRVRPPAFCLGFRTTVPGLKRCVDNPEAVC